MQLKKELFLAPWFVDVILQLHSREWHEQQVLMVGGVREVGKTTALIQLIRHLASLQTPDENGVRKFKFFLMRKAYRELKQFRDSLDEWFDESESFEAVRLQKSYGWSHKNPTIAPEIVIHEPTPDLLGLMRGEPWVHDGTTTLIEIQCYSYNHDNSDTSMRGGNFCSGMLNEAQTLLESGYEVARGTFGRPSSTSRYPLLICDFNLPKLDDIGFKWLDSLMKHDKDLLSDMNIILADIPSPFKFLENNYDGEVVVKGKRGDLVENPDFLPQMPHLKSVSKYEAYKLQGEDSILRNMLGKFGVKVKGQLLYPNFNYDKHGGHDIEPPDPYTNYHQRDNLIIVPMDFGFQPAVQFFYMEDGQARFFHEIIKEDANFFELLKYSFIPYLEEHLSYYYENQQIVIVGDPTSGTRRDAIKSATPLNILQGVTDINGDEDGDAERYEFDNVIPSPCGNVWEHRVNATSQLLTKPDGVVFDKGMKYTMDMFEKSTTGSGGTKPKKKSGDLLHGLSDTFQYGAAYITAGFESHIVRYQKKPKKKSNRRKTKYR